MLVGIFFIFFLLMALASIIVSNPVLSVLFLVLVFVMGSAFIVAIGLDYLGILLLLVYVGAISVLFLFVVMMLNVRQTELTQSMIKFWWLGILVSGFFFFELLLSAFLNWDIATFKSSLFLYNTTLMDKGWIVIAQEPSNIELLGEFLFLYNWDFLCIAILLLFIAVLGPVYLSQFSRVQYPLYKEKGWVQIVRQKSEFLSNK